MRKPRLCSVKACGGRHVARGFCMKHYQQLRWHGKVETEPKTSGKLADNEEAKWQEIPHDAPINRSRYLMASECCGARTREGEAHSIGRQYCTLCGEPCYWRWKLRSDFPKIVQNAPIFS